MLNCEYCDYFKTLHLAADSDKKTSACEFTGFIFTRDVNDLDIEPPCSNISYQSYLEKCHKNKVSKGIENGILYTKNNDKETKIGA